MKSVNRNEELNILQIDGSVGLKRFAGSIVRKKPAKNFWEP